MQQIHMSITYCLHLLIITPDLEKVVNHPQAEKKEIYNVLKIAGFATMDEQKYMYQMLVWHDEILKS